MKTKQNKRLLAPLVPRADATEQSGPAAEQPPVPRATADAGRHAREMQMLWNAMLLPIISIMVERGVGELRIKRIGSRVKFSLAPVRHPRAGNVRLERQAKEDAQ